MRIRTTYTLSTSASGTSSAALHHLSRRFEHLPARRQRRRPQHRVRARQRWHPPRCWAVAARLLVAALLGVGARARRCVRLVVLALRLALAVLDHVLAPDHARLVAVAGAGAAQPELRLHRPERA